MANLRLHQLNDVKLVGRLTRDPELRYTPKGQAVCRLRLAVSRRYKDKATQEWKEEASFIPVVVWREAAERCGERLKKGSPVYVEGRLRSRDGRPKTASKDQIWKWNAGGCNFWRPWAKAKVPRGRAIDGRIR